MVNAYFFLLQEIGNLYATVYVSCMVYMYILEYFMLIRKEHTLSLKWNIKFAVFCNLNILEKEANLVGPLEDLTQTVNISQYVSLYSWSWKSESYTTCTM